MDVFDEQGDAAVEQLYDELLARTWSVHQVMGSVTTDIDRREVTEQLAIAARRYVAALGHDGHHAADRLRRVLWPCGAIPTDGDAWWATPLGRLIRGGCPRVRDGSPVAARRD
ncbi:MAG TPA: hypothetical protein VFT09_00410 [Ilumatobacteraceae bacterium]|nr:hypothetical protein [Ilumatobacteraceae bacterium]